VRVAAVMAASAVELVHWRVRSSPRTGGVSGGGRRSVEGVKRRRGERVQGWRWG